MTIAVDGGGPGRSGFRERLRRRTPILATFLLVPRVEIVELLRSAGFDAVIIDLEHGSTAATDLPELVAAAQGAGLIAAVRVGDDSAVEVGRALDAGADAILMPHVASVADARRSSTRVAIRRSATVA